MHFAISAAEDIECGREPFRLNSKRISTFHGLGLADHAYFMPAVDFENMARLSPNGLRPDLEDEAIHHL